MKKIDEILFIVHPWFDENKQIELEFNIKSKIDSLSDWIKNGIESILVFVDEPWIDIYDFEHKNNIEIHYQIMDYLTYIKSSNAMRKIFTKEIDLINLEKVIEEWKNEKFDAELIEDLHMLLREEINILSNWSYETNDDKIFDEIYLEAFNILVKEYNKKWKNLSYEYRDFKKDNLGLCSSKIPTNVNRKSSLYNYAIEKLWEDRVIQSFMHDKDPNNIDMYFLRRKEKISNNFLSYIDKFNKDNFEKKFENIAKIINNNFPLELNIWWEYYWRCVDNFNSLLFRFLWKRPKNIDKFVNKDLSLVKECDIWKF